MRGNLREVSVFQGMSRDEIGLIEPFCEPFSLEKGSFLCRAGEKGRYLYVLMEGKVEISQALSYPAIGPEAHEKILSTLDGSSKPVIGEIQFVTDEPFSANVLCKEPCHWIQIPNERLLELCTTHPELGMKLFKNLAQLIAIRLRKVNMDVVKLALALSLAVKA